MRIALAGSGLLGATLYRALCESGHDIVAIVQDGRLTRGWKRRATPFAAQWLGGPNAMTGIARWYKIPIIWVDTMQEAELEPLRQLQPDLLLVGGFGIILKAPLLNLPAVGCVNVHSSLLPKHRGPNPFRAALLAGESETGVSFHVMTEGIDTGAILLQRAFDIGPRDTAFDIYRHSCKVAGTMLPEVLDRIEVSGLQGTPQDESIATYDKNLKEEDTWIDWRWTAEEIDRFIRALTPTPAPRILFRGRLIRVSRSEFDAEPVDAPPGVVLKNRPWVEVATGQGRVKLRVAFQKSPYPWIWPAPGNRPEVGEQLEIHGP